MREVAESLKVEFTKRGWALQVQGEKSRSEILNKHKKLIEKQKTSVLFGTGSFSEGLDLPGELLENLIITKIPFAVPTSPVEQAHAEYIQELGGNLSCRLPFLKPAKAHPVRWTSTAQRAGFW